MKRESQLIVFFLCVGLTVLALLVSVSSAAAQANDGTNGQNNSQDNGQDNNNGRGDDGQGGFAVPEGPGTNTGNCPAPPPATDRVILPKVYCPYPPGIIPSDLTIESERVRREIRGIEQQALAESAAFGPLMATSPNQVLAGNGVRAVEGLGKL